MPRYKERPLQLIDILGRFEAQSHTIHYRNARGSIEYLKDEGAKFFEEGSRQLRRWHQCCSVLLCFLDKLGQRRAIEKQGLATVMREFIQEFEHSTGRMEQMLYGAVVDPDNDDGVRQIRDWINLAFRASTYALVSGWIKDKQEYSSTKIEINVISGERREESTRTEMQVPRKYQNKTKKI